VNANFVKYGNLKILMPMLFGDGSYSIQHALKEYVKFTTLHRCNKYTSNMAAVTVVDRMTSLSFTAYIYEIILSQPSAFI